MIPDPPKDWVYYCNKQDVSILRILNVKKVHVSFQTPISEDSDKSNCTSVLGKLGIKLVYSDRLV